MSPDKSQFKDAVSWTPLARAQDKAKQSKVDLLHALLRQEHCLYSRNVLRTYALRTIPGPHPKHMPTNVDTLNEVAFTVVLTCAKDIVGDDMLLMPPLLLTHTRTMGV